MYKILLPGLFLLLFACAPHAEENLLADGGFEESATAWDTCASRPTAQAHGGTHARILRIETPSYTPVWSDICTQGIRVEAGGRYRLSAFARMSLPPLANGLYIGVRRPDGSVLADRLFLLFGQEWTRMVLDFDADREKDLTVFCGVWADQDSEYSVDDFDLHRIK